MILRQNGVKQDAKQRASKNEREHTLADDDRTHDRPRSSPLVVPRSFVILLLHLDDQSAAALFRALTRYTRCCFPENHSGNFDYEFFRQPITDHSLLLFPLDSRHLSLEVRNDQGSRGPVSGSWFQVSSFRCQRFVATEAGTVTLCTIYSHRITTLFAATSGR